MAPFAGGGASRCRWKGLSGVSEERRIDRRTVFRGRLLRVDVDRVRLPDGREVERELVHHPGAAGVLPLFPGGRDGTGEAEVVLLRQFRHAAGTELWEIPAGTLEPEETPEACAARELEEETGLVARELVPLGSVLTSPGFTDERIHLYLAPDPDRGEARPEAGEFLEPRTVALDRALAMVEEGGVEDAKTVTALLLAARATFR